MAGLFSIFAIKIAWYRHKYIIIESNKGFNCVIDTSVYFWGSSGVSCGQQFFDWKLYDGQYWWYIHFQITDIYCIWGLALFFNDECIQLIKFPGVTDTCLNNVYLETGCRLQGHHLQTFAALGDSYSYSLVGEGTIGSPELSNFKFERESSSIGAINYNQQFPVPSTFQWDTKVWP